MFCTCIITYILKSRYSTVFMLISSGGTVLGNYTREMGIWSDHMCTRDTIAVCITNVCLYITCMPRHCMYATRIYIPATGECVGSTECSATFWQTLAHYTCLYPAAQLPSLLYNFV